jgi:hypothetical protein
MIIGRKGHGVEWAKQSPPGMYTGLAGFGILGDKTSSKEGAGMRKSIILVSAILALAATSAFAKSGFAIGGEGVFPVAGSSLPTSAMLTFHIPKVPVMFGVDILNPAAIGLTVDYWFADGKIAGPFDWYVGVGAYASIAWEPSGFALGGRLPIGIQAWPFGSTLELFIELAPAVGVSVVPTAFEWHLQGALGLRVWF